MAVQLSQIPGAFHLPRLNWASIQAWVDGNVAEQHRPQAWRDIALDWLGVLNKALGNAYQIQESANILFFLPTQADHLEGMLDFAEAGLDVIIDELGDLACEKWLGPLVILLFDDAHTYAQYVSPADPELGLMGSSGACCREGYVHVAICNHTREVLESVIFHELTHACLSHLNLPLWLEEGITQLAQEAAIPNWQRFMLTDETAAEIRRYWQTQGLNDFWWGKGFLSYDEGQGHSYALASILFRLLMSDHRRRLPAFVRRAHADDAGESAARECLGMGLAQLAAQFLGTGSWEPVPTDAETFERRGNFYFDQGQFDLALADFNESLRLNSRSARTFAQRGYTHYQLGNFAASIADNRQAIQLDPQDFHAHNNLAWLLATCPEAAFRDGSQAIDHAHTACEITGFSLWNCLGTLAAAYAEDENFEEARGWAKESLRFAPEAERPGCKERLQLYKSRQPYREIPPSTFREGTEN